MYTSLALAAALWPAAVTEHCAPQTSETIIGVALSPGGKFLYCEHFSQLNEHQIHVNYSRNNTNFASKHLVYRVNPHIPSLNQLDQRTGEHREAQVDSQKVQLTYQPSSGITAETVSLDIGAVDILDAGFDNFVKDNWSDLINGKSMAVNFASIAHLKVLPLRIKAMAAAKCGSIRNGITAEYCFSVDVDNALLRLLVDNIKISYDRKKRLQQFSGVVNLQSDAHKSQHAIISYFYKEDYLK